MNESVQTKIGSNISFYSNIFFHLCVCVSGKWNLCALGIRRFLAIAVMVTLVNAAAAAAAVDLLLSLPLRSTMHTTSMKINEMILIFIFFSVHLLRAICQSEPKTWIFDMTAGPLDFAFVFFRIFFGRICMIYAIRKIVLFYEFGRFQPEDHQTKNTNKRKK